MPLLNYTTQIDVERTIGEIQNMLGRAGAIKVMTDYEGGIVSAVSFALNVNGQTIGFRLPCDWRPVQKLLEQQKARASGRRDKIKTDQVQSVRVAWRIVKDWIEAQLALVETSMVTTEQVFLPYMVVKGGKTLYEGMVDSQFRLGDGK